MLSEYLQELKLSVAELTDMIELSKTFPASDFHDAHSGQKCSRWQHGDNPPNAVKCRKSGGRHLGACSMHYEQMKS